MEVAKAVDRRSLALLTVLYFGVAAVLMIVGLS